MNVQATSEQGVGTEQLIQVLPADTVVRAAATTARDALGSLLNASPAVLDEALLTMAELLRADISQVRMANEDDVDQAAAARMSGALLDRLRLTPARLAAMSEQLVSLASVPTESGRSKLRDLPGGLVLEEQRRPVGVIGANFEARPNVVVDIASQLIKSRNAGVLLTGSAALRSAIALADHVIAPALAKRAWTSDSSRSSGNLAARWPAPWFASQPCSRW